MRRFDSGPRLQAKPLLDQGFTEREAPPLPQSFGQPSPLGQRMTIPGYLGRVGRPRQPPTIQKLTSAAGTERYVVRCRVLGKDRRKVVGTLDEAKLIASQWISDRKEEMRVLPTRLTAPKLIGAEAADPILESLGLSFVDAARWLLANYKRPAQALWDTVIAEYKTDRERIGISDSQISNVAKAARRLADSTGRVEVGNVTRDEVEKLLGTLEEDGSPATYNGLLGDVSTFLSWAVQKRFLSVNPATEIERRKIVRGLPEILSPQQVEALLRDLEKTDPAWIPYAALCVFVGLRPGTREGEANRLDADLRAGKSVVHPGGIEVYGKANGTRIVPFSGPLKAWLDVYLKPGKGLWPSPSATAAERAWAKIRKRHGLTADVLRHTAISAMCYTPQASLAQVAIAVGNSESMIRKHYLGRWSTSMTEQLYAIKPTVAAAPKTEAESMTEAASPNQKAA